MDKQKPDLQPRSQDLDRPILDVLCIGSSEVRPATGELVRDGRVVLLGRRALSLLMALAGADNEMVSNETLLKQVWAGSVVEQNTLQWHISSLRKALGPDRDHLKTFSGRGYKLKVGMEKPGSGASQGDLPRAHAGAGLRSPPHSTSANLPSSPYALLGREATLVVLLPLLEQRGVITLTGPGGIGKTQLGLEAARRSQSNFPGGIFFVDLATVVGANDVITVVISSIGTELNFHASIEDRVKGLGRQSALVVLDNCEHVIDAAAAVAETIVKSNGVVTVLATSREPLRIGREHVFRVPPLGLPPAEANGPLSLLECGATQLFLGRSAVGRARLAEDTTVGAAIANICRRLDGNPLAIELAAARADSIGIEEVAVRLDDCLSILVDGRRTALPRHQTLRATLAWSYGLLSENERALFRRLAVFSGGFTLAAACRVASGGDFPESAVVDLMSGLVNKSLVAADAESKRSRYRLLETTRAYALEQLTASGESRTVAATHLRYYIELFDISGVPSTAMHGFVLERFRPETGVPILTAMHEFALERFRPEIDNARAALNWAFSEAGEPEIGFVLASFATPLMYEQLLLEECAATASRALAAVASRSGIQRMMELRIQTSLAASLVYLRGPSAPTIAVWNDVLVTSQELHEVSYEVRALWGLWTCCLYAGLPALAMQHAEEYRRVSESQPAERNLPRFADRIVGIAHHYLGNHAATRRHLELFISRYQHGNKFLWGNMIDHATLARATLARTLWFAGLVERASDLMEMAVTEALADNNPLAICYVTVECALPVSLLLHDAAAARRYLVILRSASHRHGSMFWKLLEQCYAALLEAHGQVDYDTLTALRRGIEGLHALAFDTYSIDLRNRLAHLLHRTGRVDEALALTNRTLERLRETAERVWEPEILTTRAWLTLESGAPGAEDDARSDLRSALELARAQGALSLELRAAVQMASLMGRRGQGVEARRFLEEVCDRFSEGLQAPDMQDARALAASLG